MKIYLDDVRDTPKGWTRTYTVKETIGHLMYGKVTELSLDHDLGATDPDNTGYNVLKWMEEKMHLTGDDWFVPAAIFLHTDNPVGRERMKAALVSIEKYRSELKNEKS